LLGGLEILLGDCDLCVLLNLVPLLGAELRRFGEPGQALGVESIVGVEELLLRLVEAGQRHALQFEPVLHQILGDRVLHALDEVLPLVEQLLHRHRHRGGAQRVDEFVLDQLLQRFRIERARTQGLRRVGDALDGRDAAHEKGDDDVDAHPVLGEQAVRPRAMHFELQRVHVDPDQLVKDRQADSTTVHHDFLAAQSGAHKRPVLRGSLIEARQDQPDRDCAGQQDRHEKGDAEQIGVVDHVTLPKPPSEKRQHFAFWLRPDHNRSGRGLRMAWKRVPLNRLTSKTASF